MGPGIIGLEPDRLTECNDRLLCITLEPESQTEVEMGFGRAGLKRYLLPERRNRAVVIIHPITQDNAELEVGWRDFGFSSTAVR